MIRVLSAQASFKTTVTQKNNEERTIQPKFSFKNILFHLNELKTSQDMFDQFLEVVEEDVKTKTKLLQLLRLNDQLSKNQNTYAAVQIFMLKRYSNRIKSFQKASDNSISNICEEYSKPGRDDDKVSDLVNKHIAVLEKMKRRMKHIIDVSEKYAVVDIFTAIDDLSEDSFDLDPSSGVKDQRMTQSVTSLSTDKYGSYSSPSSSRISSPSSLYSSKSTASSRSSLSLTRFPNSKPSLRPIKSLSDHISVLTKTYSSKQ